LAIIGCQKKDHSVVTNKISIGEEKFFNDRKSSDPLVQSATGYIKRQNEKYKFVEKTIKQIGYPYWDKAVIMTGPTSSQRGTSDSLNLIYVPFVRNTQNFVNASLIIRMSFSDTSFMYLCDWQYSSFGYDTSSLGWNAFNVFHVFTKLDNVVFNRTKFRIIDENLLSQQVIDSLSGIALPFDSAKITYMLTDHSVQNGKNNLWTLVTWCDDYDICIRDGEYLWAKSASSQTSSLTCSSGTLLTVSVCTDTWQYIPSSGSGGGGGNGGGNGGGGGTPPTQPPCGTSNPSRIHTVMPCGPGWVPIEEEPDFEQQLQAWDDNIIIDPSVRLCVNAIINQLRSIQSGEIAQMIFVMSGQVPQFNWTISELPQLPAPYSNAGAITSYGLGGVHHSITQLNQSKLSNATNISIARTLLHEAIHAFIYDFIFNNDQLPQIVKDQILALPFAQKLKEFIKIKYNRPGQGNAFHNLMMKKFHDDIRDALKLVCPLMGITLTGNDLNLFCSDMAWGGLNEDQSSTSAWMDPDIGLTDEDRARITKRLDIELNNLGNFSGSYGGYHHDITQEGTKACP
jgi:hypothetical protein